MQLNSMWQLEWNIDSEYSYSIDNWELLTKYFQTVGGELLKQYKTSEYYFN